MCAQQLAHFVSQGHAALLDQRVAAGIGNVFKSEVCWAERIHPFTRVDEVLDILRRMNQLELPQGRPLHRPVNALETHADGDGIWRGRVNQRLATDYAALAPKLDARLAAFDALSPHQQHRDKIHAVPMRSRSTRKNSRTANIVPSWSWLPAASSSSRTSSSRRTRSLPN